MSIFTSISRALQPSKRDIDLSKTGSWTKTTSDVIQSHDVGLADNANDRELMDNFVAWTAKAINFRSESLVPFVPKLYDTKGNEITSSPFLDALYKFNPDMSFDEARELTHKHIDLVGSAYWYIQSTGKTGDFQLFLLQPYQVEELYAENGTFSGIKFSDKTRTDHIFSSQDIIRFKRRSPLNWQQGFSLLGGQARYSHNSILQIYQHILNAFGNAGRPNGIVSMPGALPDQVEALKGLFAMLRGVKNARSTLVTNADIKYIETNDKVEEADYTKSFAAIRDDILSLYGIPKALIGLNDSTYNNSSEAQRIYQQYTLSPILTKEANVFNNQLLKKCRQVGVHFVATDPVSKDKLQASQIAQNLYLGGIASQNEARAISGLDALPNGNTFKSVDTQPANPDMEKSRQMRSTLEAMQPQLPKDDEQVAGVDKRAFLQEGSRTNEDTLLIEVRGYFNEQLTRVLNTTRQYRALDPQDPIKFNLKGEVKHAIDKFTPTLLQMATNYWSIANVVSDTLKKPIEASVLEQVQMQVKLLAKQINNTTQDELAQLFQAVVNGNMTLAEYIDEIISLYKRWSISEMSQTRAEMIAITTNTSLKNTIYAQNYASNEYVTGLEWITANDNAVRGSDPHDKYNHAIMDGVTIAKGKKFYVSGEFLSYPGDKAGSAGNVINCRCDILPVIKYI